MSLSSPSLKSFEEQLQEAGVRVTAVRMLVWRALCETFTDAFSLADVEIVLPTVDRSTIFRTLCTLTDADLLHEIDDGSGSQKYCICHCVDHAHHVGHVHLTCRVCHKTYCLTDVSIPQVPLPSGFVVEEAEYVVKGICAKCATNKL